MDAPNVEEDSEDYGTESEETVKSENEHVEE